MEVAGFAAKTPSYSFLVMQLGLPCWGQSWAGQSQLLLQLGEQQGRSKSKLEGAASGLDAGWA